MQSTKDSLLRVAPLTELQAKGIVVVKGGGHTIAVVAHDGRVSAVDNRCPHMGFPLHKGTVQDGILTCHWHHARFDLCSGCTFDLFADDVPAYDTEVRDGIVFVASHPRQGNRRDYYLRRLQDGMQQGISLIQAKCLIGLMQSGVEHRDIVRQVALFGLHNRDDWQAGITSLTAMANLVPRLKEETAYLALYQGTRRVAADAAGQAPRRQRQALETRDHSLETLKRWLRYWTLVRQRDGAERTLLTAVENGAAPEQLADLLFTAITDRYYSAVGHLLDFSNKAFELLDLIGWQHAREVLPSIVAQLVSSRGGEESNSWRHPVDLVPPLQEVGREIVELFEKGKGKRWSGERELSAQLLGEDPLKIIKALKEAIRSGAQPQQLSKSLAYAAAMRIAHFGTAN
jgi:nitrite reductase/ring-hydroxylating ferredoxin subunit